jgi:hypothetical protein
VDNSSCRLFFTRFINKRSKLILDCRIFTPEKKGKAILAERGSGALPWTVWVVPSQSE